MISVGHRGFELQCVKLTPNSPPKRAVHALMLLDAAEAGELPAGIGKLW